MKATARGVKLNGQRKRPDPEGARKVLEEAFAYKHKRGSQFKGMTRDEIIARIKKTREELVREQFGYLFG